MTLKVIHRLQTFSNVISRTFVQHFTRFQLTVCSHDSSALAELLVTSSSAMAERPRELDQRFQMGGQFEAIIE